MQLITHMLSQLGVRRHSMHLLPRHASIHLLFTTLTALVTPPIVWSGLSHLKTAGHPTRRSESIASRSVSSASTALSTCTDLQLSARVAALLSVFLLMSGVAQAQELAWTQHNPC